MPIERTGVYTPDELAEAADRIGTYAERVRAVVEKMREAKVERLEVSNDAAFGRAIVDLKRWSRGAEDALDDWRKAAREGSQPASQNEKKRKPAKRLQKGGKEE